MPVIDIHKLWVAFGSQLMARKVKFPNECYLCRKVEVEQPPVPSVFRDVMGICVNCDESVCSDCGDWEGEWTGDPSTLRGSIACKTNCTTPEGA